jgi:adenylate cyclase
MLRLRGAIDGRERLFPLDSDEIRLGRGSDNDVVLPDFSVSRRHAALRREAGGWFIYDLKSTNGVQVNGVTVKKAPLRPADRLKIGIFEFTVEGELTNPPGPTSHLRAIEEAPAPPSGAHPGTGISSATIVRKLSDFSADYGLEQVLTPERRREDKRKALDQAYGNTIFGILTRLARLLIKANSVDEVLEQVLAIAFEALAVDRGFILLRDEGSEDLVCEISRVGDKVELRPAEVPVSKTMLEAVIKERVALLTYDAQSDQRLATGESIRIHHIRSAMCAPLWSGDHIIGVMQVDSPFHAGTFNEGDLDLFTALANYAAVAVERIRYAERVEHERNLRSRLERYHSPAVIEAVMTRGQGETAVHRLQLARVTVLFADVVGSTPLAENLPPEEVAEVLEGFFTHSVESIFKEGGTLDKFIGDCVMAFFGAPMPQADHAARAVRAAVTIQREIKRWNDERAHKGGPPLVSRIALNSGPVVVGDVGSKRRVDYTVLGNTVNVAARIEQGATAPGEIVIGGATFAELASIEGEFRTESLGEFQLKGLVQKVPVYRVLWDADGAAASAPATTAGSGTAAEPTVPAEPPARPAPPEAPGATAPPSVPGQQPG